MVGATKEVELTNKSLGYMNSCHLGSYSTNGTMFG